MNDVYKPYDSNKGNAFLIGTVDSVNNNLAYVKLRGEETAIPKGMEFPKGQIPTKNSRVVVAKISSVYMILAVY